MSTWFINSSFSINIVYKNDRKKYLFKVINFIKTFNRYLLTVEIDYVDYVGI